MNCIAIETSTNICSAALFRNKNLIRIKEVNKPRAHSKELGIMIDDLIKKSKVEVDIFDFIALSIGPGSFTGLRIGSSLAKGMAYALKIPIVMVPTLHSLENKIGNREKHSIGLYSHKDQIYIQDFKSCEPDSSIKLMASKDIRSKKLYGFDLHLADKTLEFVKVKPSAKLVGELAYKKYNEWLVEDLSKAKLNYITNLKIN